MPIPARPASRRRSLLKDAAFAQLRDAILDGTLEPGEKLHDRDLEQWLGLSRAPIRSALARLAEHGLVEIEANRYTRVAPSEPARIIDALEIAATMWQLGARLSLPQASNEQIDGFRRSFDAALEICRPDNRDQDPRAVIDAIHRAFRAPAEAAHNTVLTETLDKTEVSLAYQVALSGSFIDYDHVMPVVERAATCVQTRDVAGLVEVYEEFLEGVGSALVARAAGGRP